MRNPKFATGVGLVMHGARQLEGHVYKPRVERLGLGGRVKEWFSRVF